MASVTIRDVPEETADEIDRRACSLGLTRQEYLREWLINEAKRSQLDQLLDSKGLTRSR